VGAAHGCEQCSYAAMPAPAGAFARILGALELADYRVLIGERIDIEMRSNLRESFFWLDAGVDQA